VHDGYHKPINDSLIHDIALILLSERVNFTETVQRACLPNTEALKNHAMTPQKYTAVGFGTTGYNKPGSRYKEFVLLPHYETKNCAKHWKANITEKHMCAGGEVGKDACKGDSGGPLHVLYNGLYMQVGITSFGETRCEIGRPGVYTRVTEYMDWILEKLEP
jgi:secreted trypsin-like serine protease